MPEPPPHDELDVEAWNDLLAREHPIDDYYARSPLPIRLIERRRLAILRRFVGAVRGKTLLEVGSGGGHVLRLFPEARLTALDVSDVFLENARRNLVGYDVRFVKGELDEALPVAPPFDRIVCTEVLEHVVDPERTLRAMARRLAPDGIAVITIPNDPLIDGAKAVLRRSPLAPLLGDRVAWGGDRYHLHRWTPRTFAHLLERHFRVLEEDAAPHRLLPVRACFRCAPR